MDEDKDKENRRRRLTTGRHSGGPPSTPSTGEGLRAKRERSKAISGLLRAGGTDFSDAASCKALIATVRHERSEPAGVRFAAEMLGVLLDLYPARDLDPVAFVSYAAEALADFPEVVVCRMADPATGIARECKFAPTVAELVQWCERDEAAMTAAVATAERRLTHLSRREQLARDGLIYDQPQVSRDNWSRIATPFIGVVDKKPQAEEG